MALPALAAKWATKKALASTKDSDSNLGKIIICLGLVAVMVVGVILMAIWGAVSAMIGGAVGAAAADEGTCFVDNTAITTSSTANSDIPQVAMDAYQKAATTSGIDWTYVAALAKVESDHGRHGGRSLDAAGNVQPTPIIGVPTPYGRAQGPFQFLTSTWKTQGKDGNNDGKIDPQNIFDAAMAAAFYLKASGAPGNMDKAIWAYNHSEAYVAKVKQVAASYADTSTAVSTSATDPATPDSGLPPNSKPSASTRHTTELGGASTGPFIATTNPISDLLTSPLFNTSPVVKTGEDSDLDGGNGGWTLPMAEGTYINTARWGQPGSAWSSGYHTGLDFAAPLGTPVFAAATGTVIARPDQASWAGVNFLTIDHGTINGQQVSTWYAHLSEATVTSGNVAGGTMIGKVGALGNVSSPTAYHLHFEVRVGGKDVDPQIWLASAGAPDPTGIASDGCGPTGSSGIFGPDGSWGGYENGKIPLDALCEASFQTNLLLECNTAKALDSLNAAYQAKFKESLSPVGGYRSFEDQQACSAGPTGHMCATPGTSNHGWGTAVDINSEHFGAPGDPSAAINAVFAGAHYKWMAANAGQYGFVNPDWAQKGGSKPEPWHWEFKSSANPNGAVGDPNNGGSTTGSFSFRIATWNVLGASHTEGPGCNKCALPDSGPRMDRAVQVINSHGLSVLGMQEFQPKQQTMFKAKMPDWALFSNADNAVAWNTNEFERVSASTYTIPYFGGSPRQMPVVRLRHKASGKIIEVHSVHNPADVRGPAAHLRAQAVKTEGALTTATANAGVPVFLTGDMNDREAFFCQITGYGTLYSASGGSRTATSCTPPGHMPVDWVMGSSKHIAFSGYRFDDSPDVDYASDHPIIAVTASIY